MASPRPRLKPRYEDYRAALADRRYELLDWEPVVLAGRPSGQDH